MADRSKTIWTVILIIVAGVCWVLYQIYKHLYLPWRHRHVLANQNAMIERSEIEFSNRRLSAYLSNHTLSYSLSQLDVENRNAESVTTACLQGSNGRPSTNVEECDEPPTYSYVTHNQSEFLHDPPTYEEATREI